MELTEALVSLFVSVEIVGTTDAGAVSVKFVLVGEPICVEPLYVVVASRPPDEVAFGIALSIESGGVHEADVVAAVAIVPGSEPNS